ncbi:MAG: hypothetical protein K2X99_08205 [Gemmatimonadaceae bacterium]|nr:hypothetical protein [Gemmatimonadaceae bacterium]
MSELPKIEFAPSVLQHARSLRPTERARALQTTVERILLRVSPSKRVAIKQALEGEQAAIPVSSSDSISNRLLAEWHALRTAEDEYQRKQRSRDEARRHASQVLLVMDPALRRDERARIVRRVKPDRRDVIVLGARPTAVDVGEALDLLQSLRAEDGDDLPSDAQVSLRVAARALRAPLTGARRTQAERLLSRLLASPITDVEGLGAFRHVAVKLGRVKDG